MKFITDTLAFKIVPVWLITSMLLAQFTLLNIILSTVLLGLIMIYNTLQLRVDKFFELSKKNIEDAGLVITGVKKIQKEQENRWPQLFS